ncbi:ribosomal 50S subunit-associated protein YjgA (DUF615 family) [Actinokineospora baliensis]|uniref:hypothetical protein n=1 Tax=Actinokineospora baliensis TaxID=547056 RepID=UPI0019594E67|nr:hypothetical protein [Actinokineospora baliensis]MBM7773387.1 ribosomal 50S subunit-associated protein YjgA (DUF615 family) [Actinokineospora baliensis]
MHDNEGGVAGAIGAQMGEFASAAARGGFAVNEHGGTALLKAIANLIEWIDEQQVELRLLTRVAQLGSSNNAEIMKPYLQQVATDDRGFITQLLQLRASLTQGEEAIRQAMANYQQVDQQAARGLN